MHNLTPDGKKALRKAARGEIDDCFLSSATSVRRRKWLHKSNRYVQDCSKQYDEDLKTSPPSVDHRALAHYVAASGPTHIIDGWSFLGRAIDATLRADSTSAVHLAYYAELRAAMALLASEGIGVFNRHHPIVLRGGRTCVCPQKLGTHKFVWPCLQHWAGLSRARELLDTIVRPASFSLSNWMSRLNGKVASSVLAEKWFRTWGMDIGLFDEDHDLRNVVSYRPSEFNPHDDSDASTILSFVNDLWRCLEPCGGGRFPNFEQGVLRRSLKATKAQPIDEAALVNIFGFERGTASAWANILTSSAELSIFKAAESVATTARAGSHLSVIARSALLLLVATASAHHQMQKAGYKSLDLEFWWRRHAVARGLRLPATVSSSTDSWADLKACLDDMMSWVADHSGTADLGAWRREQSHVVESLGAMENVAIWGLVA